MARKGTGKQERKLVHLGSGMQNRIHMLQMVRRLRFKGMCQQGQMDLQDLHCRRRELIPSNCPLTSTYTQ